MKVIIMRKSAVLAIITTAVIFGLLPFSAYSADSSAAPPAFNGTSLAGWHSQGSGNWKVDHGEIVGMAKPGSDGWLLFDQGYEDFMVRFAFQCNNCETGVLFRDAKAENGTSGTYLPLAGPNIGAASRVTVDAQGSEVDHTPIGAPNGQDNHPVQLKVNPDGWNTVEIVVRGNQLEGGFNQSRLRALTIDNAKVGGSDHYGLVGLHISGGAGAEVKITLTALPLILARC